MNCPDGFGKLVYTGMSLTSKGLDEKFPEKFIYALLVNELVNTLLMRHIIKLVPTLKSVTFNSGSIINVHAIWSKC